MPLDVVAVAVFVLAADLAGSEETPGLAALAGYPSVEACPDGRPTPGPSAPLLQYEHSRWLCSYLPSPHEVLPVGGGARQDTFFCQPVVLVVTACSPSSLASDGISLESERTE